MAERVCRTCKQKKDLETGFYRRSATNFRLDCRACVYAKQAPQRDEEKMRAAQKAYYERTKGCAYIRDWRKSKTGQFSVFKGHAKARGLEVGITEDDYAALRAIVECVCGSVLVCSAKRVPNQWTLDRIDSSKGYIPGNVVPLCLLCNMSKQNHTKESWEKTKAAIDKVFAGLV